MKKSLLVLALLVIATIAYPQSRRTRSDNSSSVSRSENISNSRQKVSTPARSANNTTTTRRENISTNNNGRAQSTRVSSSSNSGARVSGGNNNQAVRRTPSNSNASREVRSSDNRTVTQSRSNSTTTTRSRTTSVSRDRATGNASSPSRSYSSTTTPSREYAIRNRSVQSPRVVNHNTSTVRVVKSPIIVRETRVVHHHHYVHRPIEYRRVHYRYRAPVSVNIVWTNRIYHDFRVFYPSHHHYIHLSYRHGARIQSISAYDAIYHIGGVKKVYGEISEVYYSDRDDVYYLYIGAPYPYHDFSVAIEGKDYRSNDFPPLFRLEGSHIWSMGLITEYDGKPEILVRRPYQLGVY